jgi:hypothetical protein
VKRRRSERQTIGNTELMRRARAKVKSGVSGGVGSGPKFCWEGLTRKGMGRGAVGTREAEVAVQKTAAGESKRGLVGARSDMSVSRSQVRAMEGSIGIFHMRFSN